MTDHPHATNETNGPGTKGTGGSRAFSHATPEGAAKKTSEVLGEIAWLMSQSQIHKRMFIQDLEWFVMAPILLQQFRLFYAKDRPIGVVLWAHANEEVAGMLAEGVTKLRPQDWDCRRKPGAKVVPGQKPDDLIAGTQAWVVEVIAPFGGAEEMVKDLKANVFPDRELRYVQVGVRGNEVRVA